MSVMICKDNEILAIYSDPCSIPKRLRPKTNSVFMDLIAGGFGIGLVYGLIVLMSAL